MTPYYHVPLAIARALLGQQWRRSSWRGERRKSLATYCLAAVDSLLREYIPSAIYPTHVDWYEMLFTSFVLSEEGKDYDIACDAGRWARGIRKIPVHIRRYYSNPEGQAALTRTIRQRYIPYVMDIARLTQRIDYLIRSDTTLSMAIHEHMGRIYPCDGVEAYATYIAQVVYHAMDRLPG